MAKKWEFEADAWLKRHGSTVRFNALISRYDAVAKVRGWHPRTLYAIRDRLRVLDVEPCRAVVCLTTGTEYPTLTLPRLKPVGFLVQRVHLPELVSLLCQRWCSPQAFCPISEASFGVPRRTVESQKLGSLCLMLEVFTRASFPARNPITSVFKVRCLSATGFLERLITLSAGLIIPVTAAKAARRYIPRLKDVGFACSTVKSAARAVGRKPEAIRLAIRRGTTSAGRRWAYVDAMVEATP